MCGVLLAVPCQRCGFPVAISHRFCTQCGIAVQDKHPVDTDASISEKTNIGIIQQENMPRFGVLEGEKRIATVLMADVRSSTDLLEDIGTEVWVEIMNQLFQLLETEIYRYGGIVDQFRGDGLVSFFGTNTAHEDDPERAILAALSMQQMVKPFADNLHERLSIDISIRIGINTGEVIVASVGNTQNYSEDTAMGEAIALASRMETAAEPGTVLVSESTYRLVQNQFEWIPLGEITVKGIKHPVRIYRPLSPSTVIDNRQNLELSNVLIGKSHEFDVLRNCIEDLTDGLGGIVLLLGEQGMGKSLLVADMRRYFIRQHVLLNEALTMESLGKPDDSFPKEQKHASQTKPLELIGRSRSYRQSQPYAVWQDLLLNWIGVFKEGNNELIGDHLRVKSEKLWGETWQEYFVYLSVLLGLPLTPTTEQQLSGIDITNIDAESLRQRFFVVIRSWLESLAQTTPVIITFNDMQWADTTSLELLKYCLPLCEYLDVLWIILSRPERTAPIWDFRYYLETEYPHRLTTLQLKPFTPEQSEEFIYHLIGRDCLPDETIDILVSQAEGNPYYIQELIRTLIANGTLVPERKIDEYGQQNEKWRLTEKITAISVPDTLQSVLTSRIDKLSFEEQQVLQLASVIGTTFWSKILYGFSSEFHDLPAHITALLRAQFITERGRVPDLGEEYIFKSNLIRDVAYTRLLRSQREYYHLQIAKLMEQLLFETTSINTSAQNYTQYSSFLAYHYFSANRPEQELTYVLKSADNASKIYANAEALKLYSRALKIIEQLERSTSEPGKLKYYKEQKFIALYNRHRIAFLLGDFSSMVTDAEELLPLAQHLKNEKYIIDALLHQPGVGEFLTQVKAEQGLAHAEKALEIARAIKDERREMESLITIVNLKLALNDSSWHALAEQALSIAHALRDINLELRLLIGIGGVLAFGDQPETSQEYFDRAVALAMNNVVDDKVIQMSLLNMLGLEYERKGDYHRLLTEYQQERLNVSREIGHRPLESQALQACGRIKAIYLGDYAAGLDDLDVCRTIMHNTPDEVYVLFHIVQIHIAQANHIDALATLKAIRTIGEPCHARGIASLQLLWIMYHNARGTRAATRGDTEEVVNQLSQALALADSARTLAQTSPFVSAQYKMAVECQAALAHLGLAQNANDTSTRTRELKKALALSEAAYQIYQLFGYVQIIETVSEEVLYIHSQVLAANGQNELSSRFLQRAYDEMMRKYALLPGDSHYRKTYLDQIPMHQQIRASLATRAGK